jgi:hypothetical protein
VADRRSGGAEEFGGESDRMAAMKTGKENKPAGALHRQQLFYWMGSSLDRKNGKRKVLRDELVQECLQHVRGSLRHGIWVKSPRVPEQFELRQQRFLLDAPIACFTEWSLGESLAHTAEYGRIGFGFPKRWVIERGGQSVTYFRHNERGSFLRCAFALLHALGQAEPTGRWTAKQNQLGFEELRYLLHFAKMIRLKRPGPKRKRVRGAPPPPVERKPPSRAAVEARTFKRKFGMPLDFVEEREWRIVYHPANSGFRPGPRSGTPDYYLPYVPGEELFTLVLPDNKVVSRVLQSDWFTERLFTPWRHYPALGGRRVPPVTLLSHSDIGTY